MLSFIIQMSEISSKFGMKHRLLNLDKCDEFVSMWTKFLFEKELISRNVSRNIICIHASKLNFFYCFSVSFTMVSEASIEPNRNRISFGIASVGCRPYFSNRFSRWHRYRIICDAWTLKNIFYRILWPQRSLFWILHGRGNCHISNKLRKEEKLSKLFIRPNCIW